jgi:hypothetical protein
LASIEPGPRGVSPQDAPLFDSGDPRGATKLITIRQGGAFRSPQWRAGIPTGRLRNPATGWKFARLKVLIRNS